MDGTQTSERPAARPKPDDLGLVASENVRLLRESSVAGMAGTLALTALYVTLSWPNVDRTSLLVWAAWSVVAGLALMLTSNAAGADLARDPIGIPYVTHVAHVVVGVVWGLLFFIDMRSTGPDPTLLMMCMVFAMSAGVMGGAGIADLGRDVLLGMWGLVIVGTLRSGHYEFALGGLAFVVIMSRDLAISQRHHNELVRLRHASQHDAEEAERRARVDRLTGLLNRDGLQQALDELAVGDAGYFTAMFIDLDHFKQVNDSHGHQIGDAVLIEVARRLTETTRSGDVVCRLGGDEFFLVILGRQRSGDLDRRAHMIEAAISGTPMQFGGVQVSITASVGVTSIAAASFDLDRAYSATDAALYAAKSNGRGQVVVATDPDVAELLDA
jgi:diguanylate cyclase (GGDEF)-like protein